MMTTRRGPELGSFLRSRRERITPDQVGIPPGVRRRTPGLRREEVAQLAGVGVTWYTWLEQGRPINVSAHVLHAVARTLRLDAAERDHLFRLAEGLRSPAGAEAPAALPAGVHAILNALDPLPAMLVNDRTDILAWNRAYGALRPGLVSAPRGERNTIWSLFTTPATEPAPQAVAVFRYRYSQHLDDPRWHNFVTRLCAASPLFARLWATQDVAPPRLCDKRYDVPGVGTVALRSTGMDLSEHPGLRIVVHTPADDRSRRHLDQLMA